MSKRPFADRVNALISRVFLLFIRGGQAYPSNRSGSFIYADYASLTPTDPRVLEEYMHSSRIYIGNPSSTHRLGVKASKALEEARALVAKLIHARPDDVIFTASGTEANNLAILGLIENLYRQGITYINMHVVMSSIEHASVRMLAKVLQDKGVQVSFAPVDPRGQVDLDELRKLISHRTVLVSVMMVNNEVGTISAIKEIAKIIRAESKMRQYKDGDSLSHDLGQKLLPIHLHVDAAQAFIHQEINVQNLGADMLTLDSHKVYGPRGVGLLWLRKGVELNPIIHGGGQEFGLRSGTEALPSIMAFAFALRLANHLREMETKRVYLLKSYFIKILTSAIPEIVIHGGINPETTAPHIVNFSLPGVDHEYLAFALDARGIFVSTRSACIKEQDESYVLRELYKDLQPRNSLRVSFGRFTTKGQVKKIASTIVALYKIHKQGNVQSSQVNGNISETLENGTFN